MGIELDGVYKSKGIEDLPPNYTNKMLPGTCNEVEGGKEGNFEGMLTFLYGLS